MEGNPIEYYARRFSERPNSLENAASSGYMTLKTREKFKINIDEKLVKPLDWEPSFPRLTF
jgi:hypothetical protein